MMLLFYWYGNSIDSCFVGYWLSFIFLVWFVIVFDVLKVFNYDSCFLLELKVSCKFDKWRKI